MAGSPFTARIDVALLAVLVDKYGRRQGIDLFHLSSRAVKNGLFSSQTAAVREIETQMGLPVTNLELR